MQNEIDSLKEEVKRLKVIIKELTAAIKVLSDKDDRAVAFIEKIEHLLVDVEDARDEMIAERDA